MDEKFWSKSTRLTAIAAIVYLIVHRRWHADHESLILPMKTVAASAYERWWQRLFDYL